MRDPRGFSNHLGVRQVARDLGLDVKTVRRWRERPYGAGGQVTPRKVIFVPGRLLNIVV